MSTNVVALNSSNAGYSAAQITLIKNTVAKDTNNDEFNLFVSVARSTGLDPLRKQIMAVVYNKTNADKRRMSIVTGIDGLRAIAARSNRYRPDENEPEFTYDADLKGPANPLGLVKAVVRIHIADANREGGWRPVAGVAYWDEFAPMKEEVEGGFDWVDVPGQTWPNGDQKRRKVPRVDGAAVIQQLDTSGQWGKMGRLMLAKCFDLETEVLTSVGFQRFSEVTAPIMQVTAGGLEPVDAKPFVQPYGGQMVALLSDDLNFCVTPNHDMVTTAGKIEAGAMYDAARTRPAHFVPRVAPARPLDAEISDAAIRLAAAYLADGSDSSAAGFRISVSRPRKIDALRTLALHHAEAVRRDAGRVVETADRDITTKADKTSFSYKFSAAEGLVFAGKTVDASLVASMSQRQARLFVDTLVDFDGHIGAAGVRRFYSSRSDLLDVFELAAVVGGYSVSSRKTRTSDIGSKPNLYVTISDRDAIPVVRRSDGGTGLKLLPNVSGEVWCVTVPSGEIIVRRNGFSMRCGNCAESQALRKAFPEDLSALYEHAEMDQAAMGDLLPSELVEAAGVEQRMLRIGGSNGILFQFWPNDPLESVGLGQIADRILSAVKDMLSVKQLDWFESVNAQSMREFWARAKTDALAVKSEMEATRARLVAAEREQVDA